MPVKNRLLQLISEKQVRDGKIIDIKQLSRETGVSRQTIYNWLDNSAKAYYENVIDAFCDYFECEISELLIRVKTKSEESSDTPAPEVN